MAWDPPKVDLDYEFTFGKHRGEVLSDVLAKDAAYLLWAVENDVIEVGNDLLDAIQQAARRR